MKKLALLTSVAAIALVCLLATAPGNADGQGEKDASAVAPFKGAIIAIGSKTDAGAIAVLKNAKVQRFAGQYFLVGTGANDHPDEWQTGKVIWVAIDGIFDITEFASIEEFEKAQPANKNAAFR
ncbi:MAG TPA: hypothetical protein VND64_04825 [Pirellulales bacterium]|nr:hypothetical protein [Pirellulales bacterium]